MSARSMRRYMAFAMFLATALPGQVPEPLGFFKNYFVTGDYVVGGVGMRGKGVPAPAIQAIAGGTIPNYATATIPMSGVPQNANIVAAFLYWQTMENSVSPIGGAGVFRGKRVLGTQIARAGVLGCWGSGGGSGTTSGAQPLRVYRADVLRYLPFTQAANGMPT